LWIVVVIFFVLGCAGIGLLFGFFPLKILLLVSRWFGKKYKAVIITSDGPESIQTAKSTQIEVAIGLALLCIGFLVSMSGVGLKMKNTNWEWMCPLLFISGLISLFLSHVFFLRAKMETGLIKRLEYGLTLFVFLGCTCATPVFLYFGWDDIRGKILLIVVLSLNLFVVTLYITSLNPSFRSIKFLAYLYDLTFQNVHNNVDMCKRIASQLTAGFNVTPLNGIITISGAYENNNYVVKFKEGSEHIPPSMKITVAGKAQCKLNIVLQGLLTSLASHLGLRKNVTTGIESIDSRLCISTEQPASAQLWLSKQENQKTVSHLFDLGCSCLVLNNDNVEAEFVNFFWNVKISAALITNILSDLTFFTKARHEVTSPNPPIVKTDYKSIGRCIALELAGDYKEDALTGENTVSGNIEGQNYTILFPKVPGDKDESSIAAMKITLPCQSAFVISFSSQNTSDHRSMEAGLEKVETTGNMFFDSRFHIITDNQDSAKEWLHNELNLDDIQLLFDLGCSCFFLGKSSIAVTFHDVHWENNFASLVKDVILHLISMKTEF